ncbi:hypothetical protein V6N12_008049 [Hibiscus sabdariffa]|uniref:Uncharacterized protein n=1 Tax=Hibiscus sabdariffa TaxID=183260 RepID=A0ABR2BTA3_9ROSI
MSFSLCSSELTYPNVEDGESLPKELIPIAWTSSDDTRSFLETRKFDAIPDPFESERPRANFDSFSAQNGSYRAFSQVNGTKSRKVVMGIRHATWPHYGVQELLSLCYKEKDFEGLPFDFYGGFIGYMGCVVYTNVDFFQLFLPYRNKMLFKLDRRNPILLLAVILSASPSRVSMYNLKVECGAASNAHKSTTPDACFFVADNLVVIDHHSDDVYVTSLHKGNTTKAQWLDDTEKKLVSLKGSATGKLDVRISKAAANSPHEAGFHSEKSREQYVSDIEKCLKYIKDGESYELGLTTQFRKFIGEVDPLRLYLHLREKNPAPYAL